MAETLVWEDYLTVGLYFAVVLAVGIWSTFRQNRGSTTGYFLAGKNMLWLPVGASIYASNVGAPMFVGLAGTAAASGLAVSIYEWHAVYIIISLGWIFVPVYVASGQTVLTLMRPRIMRRLIWVCTVFLCPIYETLGTNGLMMSAWNGADFFSCAYRERVPKQSLFQAYTMPEYLKKRYGGRRIRTYTSVLALVMYILRNISGEIYSGALFMHQLLGWNLYLCVITILAIVAIYTVIGGLRAVIFTDTLQTFILVAGAIMVTIISFHRIGGYNAMMVKYKQAATNYTLANQSLYACGMPREDSFHIFRDPLTADIPWTGATIGLTILALFVWCQDQLIVQRCLSAKNMVHAKGGTLVAAGLKFLSLPLFVFPGMISRILFTEEVACADPDRCHEICENRAGCANLAYPLLVLRILPAGARGLMLAALLASLMSTLTSVFNSASSIVTLDLWGQFRKRAKQAELMIVGRVTVLVMVGISILWLPILQGQQGGLLWFYIAAICAYLSVPWCMAFLLGLFWKRTSEPGIFWGMMIGLVVGVVRMILDMVMPPPVCGSGQADERISIIARVDFLHFSIINAIICLIAMVMISLLTKPRTEQQLHRVTWWTRHDIPEPDLTDDEEEIDKQVKEDTGDDFGEMDIDKSEFVRKKKKFSVRCKQACYNWVCGDVKKAETHISPEERALLRLKMTSIKQKRTWTILLNVIASCLIIAITFLFGFYA